MTIDNSGNVGIGTNNVELALNVYANDGIKLRAEQQLSDQL